MDVDLISEISIDLGTCLRRTKSYKEKASSWYPSHLEQFDKAIATALKSLLASGASRTTPLAL